ncbi:MAG: bifunctional DNA-formamidopyrimidine glycosylase/DNA-(apurinic or apyrimidinic site) lyase [Thermoflexales bacterium]|nr:bifunctional DNA-formamidopyrimidine glycosylase/DNA-(apurinic or apyrimidinic site) lyase [Thermoflexales bacterium]MCX7939760.1 bifunctional DNA-formamidopyrimidine glycosylase/DNA-(apurinic or apyrimidinic site) lyase [Thermoflexales bacterium]MDW8053539.1 bifunctional DNA-formamidopyrimidine glycosylase/DNA-(apurinic or apyrimidinic site) lyase [Anaerolineae bacterium]MDW8292165.1 bifunctional DNA-formamidopyrimidine glycosylase/DNA-(apurinic or apyrimidinic site) lyase [Anaerolineae bact
MPELPEVETIARLLAQGGLNAPAVLGRRIEAVEVHWQRTIAKPEPATFVAQLAGRCIHAVRRYGKYLLLDVDEQTLLIHLRMSGRLAIVPRDQAFTAHTRVALLLDDGSALRFEDARKFGRMWLVCDPSEVLDALGPDALAVDFETFAARLRAHHRRLKPLLLNQAFIAGVGNIYADEALHRAGLHPLRQSHLLAQDEVQRLFNALHDVLREGIAANGASFDWVYPGGEFQHHFKVYGRAGQPCQQCGSPIKRIVVAQRGTYLCEHCQPLPT